MNFLDVLVEELYNNDKEIKKSDIPDGFGIPTTPVVSYFCFNESLDIEYYKDEVLKEESLSTYANAPITDDHPNTFVTVDNATERDTLQQHRLANETCCCFFINRIKFATLYNNIA